MHRVGISFEIVQSLRDYFKIYVQRISETRVNIARFKIVI